MRGTRIVSRLAVGFGFLAIAGALFFRATQFYRAPSGWLGLLSGLFLLLAFPWIVSALRIWNVRTLSGLAFMALALLPGLALVAVMAARAHQASDFAAHAVPRTATVTAVRDQTVPDPDGGTDVSQSDVTLALAEPVAGRDTVVLRLPHGGLLAGEQVKVLVDPRHPSDVELPEGWKSTDSVLWLTFAGILIGEALLAITVLVTLEGPRGDGRKPDFLDETFRSWARWRAEPQDFIPWTATVRAVAWLPFFAITALAVHAIAGWPQWWLFLLPAVPSAIGSAVAAARRSFPRLRDAALPLASLSAATAAPVLLITGTLSPAAGLPLTAAAWLTAVIAVSLRERSWSSSPDEQDDTAERTDIVTGEGTSGQVVLFRYGFAVVSA
jgi:hypothetical protein